MIETRVASPISWPRIDRTPVGKPKVLHVGKYYPPHHGGMESHLELLCHSLKRDVELDVIVANRERHTLVENEDGFRVRRLGTLLEFAATPICPELTNAVRQSNADLIHIHWPHPAAVLAYLFSGTKAQLVITYHSDVIRQKFLSKAFAPFLNQALSRARIIVSSPNYMESSDVLRRHRDRCRIVPFGIPLEDFNPPAPELITQIRRHFGPRLIVAVGRMVYYKGFDVLIRAMQHVNGTLVLAGDGPLRLNLQALAKQLNVSSRVNFLGSVKTVVPYLYASEVFVMPSVARSEAFGIAQLEAMACGTPVVNTALDSGVPFVSQHNVTGLTVPPSDPEALAGALRYLLDNEAVRQKFGAAGRRRVEQEFTVARMAQQTLEVYDFPAHRNLGSLAANA